MRCPKCGNEIEQQSQGCSSCGASLKGEVSSPTADDKLKSYFDSIKKDISNSPEAYKSSSNTSKLKTNTDKLNSTTPSAWLPKAFANLPVAKINVSLKYVIPFFIIVPLICLFGYFWSTNQLCLGCHNISGRYTTNLAIDDKEMQLEISLLQFGTELGGQVLLHTKVAPTPELTLPTTTPTSTPTPKIKQFVETVKQTYINGVQVHLETYPKVDKFFTLDFNGQYHEDATLQGEITLDFPAQSVNNRKITVTLTKL